MSLTSTGVQRAWVLSAIAFALLASACEPSAPARAWQGVVRDSSGVAIVENTGTGLWGDTVPWTIAEQATIGAVDGDAALTFGTIADVRMNDRGEVFVLDRQASQVRVFDSVGAHLRTLGRPGEGPGELSSFTYSVLLLGGDTVAVPDRRQGRLALFGPEGEILDPVGLEGSITSMKWGAPTPDRLVFRSLQNSRSDDGVIRSWDGILAADRSGAIRDTLYVIPEGINPRGPPGQYVAPLLIVGPIWTVLPDGHLAVTRTDSEQIRILTPDGETVRVIRHAGWVREPVSDAQASRMRSMFLERYTDRGMDFASADSRFASQLGMEAFPAVTQILAGPRNTIWVRRMGTLDEIDPLYLNAAFFERLGSTTWDVFQADGKFLGTLETPDDVDLMSASGDHLLGVHRDELGVQTVKIYRVLEGPDSAE